ncbi:MAG: transcriptional activator NhaR [Planctomycetes bacterium]|nr:transcriptional activator NhaR [Planctomycetota bacterium]
MEWLNYHHLRYFWVAAREGGIARASKLLHLSQPAISTQIKSLEHALGERLFVRAGRRLQLTEMGRLVQRYADEIFTLGRELLDTLKDRPTGRPLRFQVGIADAVPKQVAFHALEPALRMPEPVQLVCREDKPERLLAELSVFGLDLLISDVPLGPIGKVRAFHHRLGTTSLAVYGSPEVARRARTGFPRSLDGMPFLLPAEGTALRRSVEAWFEHGGLRPRVVGEFDDSAMLEAFARAGLGLLVAPANLEADLLAFYRLERVAEVPELEESLYAITVERRVKHPAVLAILAAAKKAAPAPRSPR